jgi:hypothetical protein
MVMVMVMVMVRLRDSVRFRASFSLLCLGVSF